MKTKYLSSTAITIYNNNNNNNRRGNPINLKIYIYIYIYYTRDEFSKFHRDGAVVRI